MNNQAKSYFIIEVVRGAEGGNRFLCSFPDNDSNEAAAEIPASLDIPEKILASKKLRSAADVICILPADFISFKILTFPFKLKNSKQIANLIGPAIEEQNPVPLSELGLAFTKINDFSILVEYARKDKINKLLEEIELINGSIFKREKAGIRVKLLSPYSLLYKIVLEKIKRHESPSDDAVSRTTAVYNLNGNNFGILLENRVVNDIMNLNLPFNSERLKTAELSGAETIFLELDLSSYLHGADSLKRKDMPGFFGMGHSAPTKGLSGYVVGNYRKIFAFSIAFFILSFLWTAWQAGSVHAKLNERDMLNKKIGLILKTYLIGQNVFLEPKFDIKNYYDSLKKNTSSESAGKHFLDMFQYISSFKPSAGSLKINKLGYSLGRYNISGTIADYNSLNRFEKYLGGKYSKVNVVNSEKTESGVSFTIYLSS